MRISRDNRQILNRYSWFPVDENGRLIQETDKFEIMSGLKKTFKTLDKGICSVYIFENIIKIDLKKRELSLERGNRLRVELVEQCGEFLSDVYIDETVFVSNVTGIEN